MPNTDIMRHLPNLISALRIVLVAPLILAIVDARFAMALWIAAIAGVSDAADGFLARHFDWRSKLGALLDPLADKLLLVAAYLTLAEVGRVVFALAWLVLARDAAIVLGALFYERVIGDFEARPSLLSKTNTLVQILYVLVTLFAACLAWHAPWLRQLGWVVAVTTVVSGADYLARWGLRAQRVLHRQRGVSR